MQAIPAANDLSVQYDAVSWRLISHELAEAITLVEATPEGLVTHPVFRAARALSGGTIAPAQIVRVLLGWAPESNAWRMGLLLTDSVRSTMDTTQMQWCELAAWPDTGITGEPDQLRYAGQALARLINRPFQFVAPTTPSRVPVFAEPSPAIEDDDEDAPVQVDASTPRSRTHESIAERLARPPAYIPEIQLADLPIVVGSHRLIRTAAGMRWERMRGSWIVDIGRLTLIFLLAVLFLVLGIGSLTRGLADVEPTQLPTFGIVIGVLLMLSLLQSVWRLLSAQSVTVDTFQKEVYEQGLVLRFINWRVPFNMVEYVLITQQAPRSQGRQHERDPMRTLQDVWIHVYDGEHFHKVNELENVEGRSWEWETVRTHHRTAVRRKLQLSQYDSPAHHAAKQIADIIGVPVYLDLV